MFSFIYSRNSVDFETDGTRRGYELDEVDQILDEKIEVFKDGEPKM